MSFKGLKYKLMLFLSKFKKKKKYKDNDYLYP